MPIISYRPFLIFTPPIVVEVASYCRSAPQSHSQRSPVLRLVIHGGLALKPPTILFAGKAPRIVQETIGKPNKRNIIPVEFTAFPGVILPCIFRKTLSPALTHDITAVEPIRHGCAPRN